LPAQQGFEAGDAVQLQIELRLVDQPEFLLCQRTAKIDLEIAAGLHLLIHRFSKKR
jgi:hypothetical protein